MRRDRLSLMLWLTWPTLSLLLLAVIPFALLVRISFAARDPSGLWADAFTVEAYRGLLDPQFVRALGYSIGLALLVAAISVGMGLPLTYFIARMRQRSQVVWLVFLLVTLSLSDVLIAFSWQVLLSKRIGLANVLVWLGFSGRAHALTPSAGAVVASLIYLVMPFTVLMLYPSLSQLSPALIEAARTMGASPLVAFRTVVVPLTRRPLVVAFLASTVLALGAYVPPIVLGRPQGWTVAVLIGNSALAGHDIPRAAAMSLCLLCAIGLLAGGLVCLTRARREI